MRSKKEKLLQYMNRYGAIPRDRVQRLEYLFDTLNIDDAKADEILQYRNNFINSTYYTTLHIVLYEEPEHTPRPRARIVHRSNLINAATGSNDFIQIYSITGRENKEFMKMYTQQNINELDQLLCTPCDIEYRVYFPTPRYYNKTQVIMAEIGLDRPIIKPDFDNIEKSYADAFTGNIWIDDIVVIDATIRKYYSVLPRVEIILKYQNHLYNNHQFKSMIKRKDFPDGAIVDYFRGGM